MVRTCSADDLPDGLVAELIEGRVLRPERIAAGRWRAFCGPVSAAVLAALLVEDTRRA